MVVKNEISFAAPNNQLFGGGVIRNCISSGLTDSLPITKFADFMLNTGIPSLVSKGFLKKISFPLSSFLIRCTGR